MNWAVIVPLMIAVTSIQAAVPLARLGTTYRAVETGLSVTMIGVISAAFALLPIFAAVPIGRMGDRGRYGLLVLIGSLLMAGSVAVLWLAPSSLGVLLGGNLVLGIGHIMLMNSTQLFLTRASGSRARDSLLGYYVVATALGQIIGPFAAGLVISDGAEVGPRVLMVCAAFCLPLLLGAGVLFSYSTANPPAVPAETVRLSSILRTPGLLWIILASSLLMAANDMLVVFLPLIANDQGIGAETVAMMLTARSIVTLGTRLVFARLIAWIGRMRLAVSSILLAGACFVLMAVPLGEAALYAWVILSGLGFGLALPLTLSLTFAIAKPETYGATTSLRITASRVAQFALPLAAGASATLAGAGTIFLVMGVVLLAIGLTGRGRAEP